MSHLGKIAGGAVALGLIVGASAVSAKGADGDRGARIDRLFERLDANGDGAIDRDEAAAARKMRFQRADVDGDGALSLEEMTAMATKRAERRARRTFERLDANDDGVVDEAEVAAGQGSKRADRQSGKADRLFARFDADGDGRVTREEIRAKRGARSE